MLESVATFSSSDYDKIVVYKFHLTWIVIFVCSLLAFKFIIGPWLISFTERLGDQILNKFFGRLLGEIQALKDELKQERHKE